MLFDVLNLLGLAALAASGWALVGNLQALSAETHKLRRVLVRALAVGAGLGVLCVLARYPYGEVLLDPAGRTRWIIGFPFPASGDAGDLCTSCSSWTPLSGYWHRSSPFVYGSLVLTLRTQ